MTCVLKVVNDMTSYEIAKQVLQQTGGIAKTSQFREAGLENYTLCALCEQGLIVRVRHGYYQQADAANLTEAQLLERLLPDGIICMESALFYYGYSDFTPRLWTVAVPRTVSRTRLKIDAVPLKPYFVQEKLFDLGKATAEIDGARLPIYDRERTICDCFKYRAKMDNELFSKALNAYANDTNKNLKNLSAYAKKLRVYKKVTELMEVLLNG